MKKLRYGLLLLPLATLALRIHQLPQASGEIESQWRRVVSRKEIGYNVAVKRCGPYVAGLSTGQAGCWLAPGM
jgi:hypothetical protein